MRNRYYIVVPNGDGVIVRRTAERFADLAELRPAFDAIYAELEGRSLHSMRLLIDLRDVVGRNDPEFEQAIAPLRRELMESFAEFGMLVQSSIGALQVRRHLINDGLTAEVFCDVDDALRWLRSTLASASGEGR